MDKFVVRKGVRGDNSQVTFNVHKAAYDVVRDMAQESGRSLSEIFDLMVEFCSERFIVSERKDTGN